MSIPVWFQQWHLGQNTGKPAQTAYVNRVTADGGIVEAIGCVPQAVWDWVAPVAPTLLLDLFPNAAAAYSLRKLRAAYSGAAVRVRRSSDNTEQDIAFDANGDLDTASLLSFVNADVNTFVSDFANSESIIELGGTGQSNQSIGGRTGLYKFTYTGGATAHQAYLTGKHPDSNNTYSVIFNIYFPTGQACNGFSYLKPDGTSDTNHNLTQGVWHSFSYTDINGGINLSRFIPSVNGVANTADDGANFYLDAWVITQTSADGFVTAWYDQSLSNDATQITAANQPKIVSAGSLVTEGTSAKPAIDFDGVNDNFNLPSAITNTLDINNDFSFVNVFKTNNNVTLQNVLGSAAGSLNRLGIGVSSTGHFAMTLYDGVLKNRSGAINLGQQYLIFSQNISTTPFLYIDGVSQSGTNSSAISSAVASTLGSRNDGNLYLNGSLQEIIIYPSNQSTNRTGIETNINTFYSIF